MPTPTTPDDAGNGSELPAPSPTPEVRAPRTRVPDRGTAGDDAQVTRDVVFAHRDTGDLLLDLYRPTNVQGPVPVVVWVHGGGWFTGDRTLAPDLAGHARATGCAMASIEYRLSGEALFPAQLHDVRAAVRFLRGHAAELGLDPDRIGVWGASAGGHLATLVGLTGNVAWLPGEVEEPGGVTAASSARETGETTEPTIPGPAHATDGGQGGGGSDVVVDDASVQAVAQSYAPVDLAAVVAWSQERDPGSDGTRTPEARVLGGHPSTRPVLARAANPLTWIRPDAPPFQLSHGTGDVLVPHTQSEALHAALTAAGATSELYLLDGYRHGFLNPPGRLDVTMAAVMDDGRLDTEGPAVATHRGAGTHHPQDGERRTTFDFADVHRFLREHLNPSPTTGVTP